MTGGTRTFRARRGFARDERGSATIEFVLWFPFFFIILVLTVDIMLTLIRATMFDRAFDMTIREVRLGTGAASYQQFKDQVCSRYFSDVNCQANLTLDLRPVDAGTFQPLPTQVECMNREENIEPVVEYNVGTGNELMLVRACMFIDPLVPFIPLWLYQRDERDGLRFMAASAFVNEPR